MQEINQSSFFGTLFDFTFSQFVSETLVRVLYLVAIGLAVIAAIIAIIAAFFNYNLSVGISVLILAPLVLLVYIVIVRVIFEFVIVVFRIADHTRQIAENTIVQTVDENEA
jgi:membrane protein YdbS with pleckstrin-like domain